MGSGSLIILQVIGVEVRFDGITATCLVPIIENNHIEFENFSFLPGEITASVLNITHEVYHTLKDKLALAKEKTEEYKASRNTATLKKANRLY